MAEVSIVYYSGSGRTAQVAERVYQGLVAVPGVTARLITVAAAMEDLGQLDSADTIVFGTPTYMGSVAAPMKAFMDATSQTWYVQGWKDKLAAGFTNSVGLNGDKLNTLQTLAIFAAQHSMIWISQGLMTGPDQNRLSSWLGLMTQTDQGADSPHPTDLATAEQFGHRIAQITLRWVKGQG
ncbi:MAG: flavodoxin family protein [Thermostichales cyanobacterium SZTDM-1c_bins_54]